MKKRGIIILALSLLLAMPSMAQTKLVKQVERMVKKDKSNLVEARKLLAPAFENPETANDVNTWYVAGLIEETAVDRDYLTLQLGQEIDETRFYNHLLEMTKYYFKVDELDAQPDNRGRVRRRYTKKIEGPLATYYPLLVNGGAMYMGQQEFEKSHEFFQAFLDVKKMEIFEKMPEISGEDELSMEIGFFNAYVLSQIEGKDEAAAAAYEAIKDRDYRQNDVYQLLAVQYYKIKDHDAYVRTLEEGAQLFPEEEFFISNLIDTFIKQNELDAATAYLDKALAAHPDNALFLFIYGYLYETGYNDIEKAIEKYEEAAKADPTSAKPVFGLGRCYFNDGHNIANAADITNEVAYREANQKATELYKKALPYFEKAVEIEPENADYLRALSSCYYVLGMEEERTKIDELLTLL